MLGKPYVRIAALPTDRFPSDGKAVSAFAKTVLSNPSLRSVLASSTPSFYSAITKSISDGAFDDQTVAPKRLFIIGGCSWGLNPPVSRSARVM